MEKIKQTLQRHYDSGISQNEMIPFLRGLNSYIDYCLSVPELKEVFDSQMNERRILIQEIETIDKQVKNEIDYAKKKLLDLIRKSGTDVSNFIRNNTYSSPLQEDINLLQELERYEKGTISTSCYLQDTRNNYLADLAMNLCAIGYEKEVEEFIVAKDSRNNRDTYSFLFSGSIKEYHEKKDSFDRKRKLENWGSFELSVKFNESYVLSKTKLKDESFLGSGIEKGEWFDSENESIDIYLMANDIQKHTDARFPLPKIPNIREIRRLDKDALDKALDVVHGVLLEVLDSENVSKKFETEESIQLKTLGVKIVDGVIYKGKHKISSFNPAEKKIVYFLYRSYINEAERCFRFDELSEKLICAVGTIKNAVSNINRVIKDGGTNKNTSSGKFIKHEKNRGYHINKKFFVQKFTKTK